jgi:cytochrome b561
VRRLRRDLVAAGADAELAGRLVAIESEREMLLGRLAYLEKSKLMFGAWHVFHQPFVYVMLAIVAMHVGVAIYFGYTIIPFGRG